MVVDWDNLYVLVSAIDELHRSPEHELLVQLTCNLKQQHVAYVYYFFLLNKNGMSTIPG